MIILKGIKKKYRMGTNIVMALDGIDLEIEEGEFVAIIGPSGSGKSTLMNIIGCLDAATEGTYILDDIPIKNYKDHQLADIRNRRIGFVFQQFNLLNHLSAAENVEVPLTYNGMSYQKRRKKADELLEAVGLKDRAHHRPTELSGGQQQRVSVARALANDPSIILADEPTGALDSKTGAELMDLLTKLNQSGRTIILITHDTNIARYAHRLITIKDGKIESDTGRGVFFD